MRVDPKFDPKQKVEKFDEFKRKAAICYVFAVALLFFLKILFF